jgi:hypothetical protein
MILFKKYIRNEKGSQLIEFLAVFPMIIFALLFIWQVALVAYAVVVSEAAARDGARVASVDGDFEAAVESSAYGLDIQSVTSGTGSAGGYESVTVTVVTKVPTVSVPFLGKFDYNLKADATMPKEGDETDE